MVTHSTVAVSGVPESRTHLHSVSTGDPLMFHWGRDCGCLATKSWWRDLGDCSLLTKLANNQLPYFQTYFCFQRHLASIPEASWGLRHELVCFWLNLLPYPLSFLSGFHFQNTVAVVSCSLFFVFVDSSFIFSFNVLESLGRERHICV